MDYKKRGDFVRVVRRMAKIREARNAYRTLMWKPLGKRSLIRLRG
jgi:hypothetical protein